MTFYRTRAREQGSLGSRELAACPSGQLVRAAGLLVVQQSPPTAKGFTCSVRLHPIPHPQLPQRRLHLFHLVRRDAGAVADLHLQRELHLVVRDEPG